MKVTVHRREPVPPPPPEVERVVLELTLEEAEDLKYLVAHEEAVIPVLTYPASSTGLRLRSLFSGLWDGLESL